MLQVYQVYHQLSPWYIYSICTWFKLHDPGPSVTSYKCTRSIINYHPGTYIQYAHGSSYMTQGLLSHPTSVPGLSSTITLVSAVAHINFSPGAQCIVTWFKVTLPRSVSSSHFRITPVDKLSQSWCMSTACTWAQLFISVYSFSIKWFDLHQIYTGCLAFSSQRFKICVPQSIQARDNKIQFNLGWCSGLCPKS